MRELGLKPKARIVATAVVGDDPEYMLTGNVRVTYILILRCHSCYQKSLGKG
jgi:acetyl-CoA acetyltransferase